MVVTTIHKQTQTQSDISPPTQHGQTVQHETLNLKPGWTQESTGHKTQNKDKQNKSNTENWNDEEHGPYQKRFITHLA
jgi:hypothetical protein